MDIVYIHSHILVHLASWFQCSVSQNYIKRIKEGSSYKEKKLVDKIEKLHGSYILSSKIHKIMIKTNGKIVQNKIRVCNIGTATDALLIIYGQ